MKLPKYYILKIFLRSGQIITFKCKGWKFTADQNNGVFTKFSINGCSKNIQADILLKEIIAYTSEEKIGFIF